MFDDEDRCLPRRARRNRLPRARRPWPTTGTGPRPPREAFRNGWLHTGDVGRMDEDGFFYIVDRKNDMLISGGYNVYPREVEDVLLACEGVVEAAVVGLPDEKWGDRVHAVVAGRPGLEPSAILAHAREHLASFKRPEGDRGLARICPRAPPTRSCAAKSATGSSRAAQAGGGGRRHPMNDMHLVLHGLAVKKHADAEDGRRVHRARGRRGRGAVAKLRRGADACRSSGRYMLDAAARWRSTPNMPRSLRRARQSRFHAGYDGFERLNVRSEATDHGLADHSRWRRARPNDHSDMGLRHSDHRQARRAARARRGDLGPLARGAALRRSTRGSCSRRSKGPKAARSPGSATPRSPATTRSGSSCTKTSCACSVASARSRREVPWHSHSVGTLALDGRSRPSRELIGGKAWSVARMQALGLTVPPAFVVTTVACRGFLDCGDAAADWTPNSPPAWLAGGSAPAGASATGRVPLLVSVRSGAADLDAGHDGHGAEPRHQRASTESGAGDGSAAMPTFARDTHRRFLELYANIVLKADVAGTRRSARHRRAGAPRSTAAGGRCRRRRASSSRRGARRLRVLEFAARAPLPPASRHRRQPRHGGDGAGHGLRQSRPTSGTGVLFSRNPLTGEPAALRRVPAARAGRGRGLRQVHARAACPCSRARPTYTTSSARRGARSKREHGDVQDIEFTVERGSFTCCSRVRPSARRRPPCVSPSHGAGKAYRPDDRAGQGHAEQVRILLEPAPARRSRRRATVLARGEAASPGVGGGMVVTDSDEAETRRAGGEARRPGPRDDEPRGSARHDRGRRGHHRAGRRDLACGGRRSRARPALRRRLRRRLAGRTGRPRRHGRWPTRRRALRPGTRRGARRDANDDWSR